MSRRDSYSQMTGEAFTRACQTDPNFRGDFPEQGAPRASQERDPNTTTGHTGHAPGIKTDAGKPRAGLMVQDFALALQAVAEVTTFGAEKYTASGWLAVPNRQARYTDAMFRHLLTEQAGQLRDPESGLLHAAHAAWNALARLELLLREGAE